MSDRRTEQKGKYNINIDYAQDISIGDRYYPGDEAYDVRGLANPYLGLQAFTYNERDRYAGREEDVDQSLLTLTLPGDERSLLFITGASGSGKSSFAQAGLLPALEQHYQQQDFVLKWAVFRPGEKPLAALTGALRTLNLAADGVFAPAAKYQLAPPPKSADPNQVSILIIDQFEELFTQSESSERNGLFAMLAEIPAFRTSRLHVIVTMRADYLPDLFEHKALYDIAKVGIDLRVMNEEQLKVAIQRPMQVMHPNAGKRFQDSLLGHLAQDACEDAAYLPLLQVTLEDLWRTGILTIDYYLNLSDAIRKRADEIYAYKRDSTGKFISRTAQEKENILNIFLALVDVSADDDLRRDVRRTRRLQDVTHGQRTAELLVQELATARLLTTSEKQLGEHKEQVETVDIIHESLFQNWTLLSDTIQTQREYLQQRGRFEQRLIAWLENQKSKERLLSDLDLAEAENLQRLEDVSVQSANARDFITRSIRERDDKRQRTQRIAIVVAAVLGVLIIVAGVAAWQAVIARNNAVEAKATAEANEIKAEKNLNQAQRNMSLYFAKEAEEQLTCDPIASLYWAARALPGFGSIRPEGEEKPDRPYVPEAEFALTQALRVNLEEDYQHVSSFLDSADQIAFGPEYIAVGGDGLHLVSYDLTTVIPLIDHSDIVIRGVAWQKGGEGDDALLSYDMKGDLLIWDSETDRGELDEPVTSWTPHESEDTHLAYLWDGDTGEEQGKQESHYDQYLASGSEDGTVSIRQDSEEIMVLRGHKFNPQRDRRAVLAVLWLDNGYVITVGVDGWVRRWHVLDEFGEPMCNGMETAGVIRCHIESHRFSAEQEVYASFSIDEPIHWLDDGSLVVIDDMDAGWRWWPDTGEEPELWQQGDLNGVMSVVWAGWTDTGMLLVEETGDGFRFSFDSHQHYLPNMPPEGLTLDSVSLDSGTEQAALLWSNGLIQVWNLKTDVIKVLLDSKNDDAFYLDQKLHWLPNGKQLLSVQNEFSEGAKVTIWDAETAKPIWPPWTPDQIVDDSISTVALSPTNDLVAITYDNALSILELRSGDLILDSWEAHNGEQIRGVQWLTGKAWPNQGSDAINPIRLLLLTWGGDGTARFWHWPPIDLEPPHEVRRIVEPGKEPIKTVAVSHDGSQIVTVNETDSLRVWPVWVSQPATLIKEATNALENAKTRSRLP